MPPPRLSFGRVILLSASVRFGPGDFAPGSKILLCESFGGSVKATQTDAFETIASLKILSGLDNCAFSETGGGWMVTSSSTVYNSLLNGGLTAPVNPAHP